MSTAPHAPRAPRPLGDDERAALLVRRVAALFASVLIGPGAGQLAMGRRLRALVWFAVAALTVLPGPLYSIWAFWANLPLRVLAGVDALALSRPARGLPRWGAVLGSWALLMAVSFGLKIGAGQVYLAVVAPDAALAPGLELGEQALALRLDRGAASGVLVVVRDPKDETRWRLGRVIATAGQRVEVRQGRPWVDGRELAWEPRKGPCTFDEPATARGARPAGTAVAPGAPANTQTAPRKRPCRLVRETSGSLSYLVYGAEPPAEGISFAPRVVPAGRVFVLGDNRATSAALLGSLPAAHVVARLRTIWWSAGPQGLRWDRIGLALR